jgi:hypothetical protein
VSSRACGPKGTTCRITSFATSHRRSESTSTSPVSTTGGARLSKKAPSARCAPPKRTYVVPPEQGETVKSMVMVCSLIPDTYQGNRVKFSPCDNASQELIVPGGDFPPQA